MRKVLMTGFDPFGGEKINPSWEAVRRVQTPEGTELVRLQVPTEFTASAAVVEAAVRRHRPELVICVGQAGGRSAVTPERVAINLDDARIPDNAGAMPRDAAAAAGGPAAYFATLPVKAMVRAIGARGLPAEVSCSAGTFVCNHLMYSVLHLAAREFPTMKAGFIHVPLLPEQAEGTQRPSLPLEAITAALEAALAAALDPDSVPAGDVPGTLC